MATQDSPNSDNQKKENPYSAKPHKYDESYRFEAKHVKRIEAKKDKKVTWEFSNGSGMTLKITHEDDYNIAEKLPKNIRDLELSKRTEFAVDLWWRWVRGKPQDKTKVVDLMLPAPKQAALIPPTQPYVAPPITNPNPMSADELAARRAKAAEQIAAMKAQAKAAHVDDDPFGLDDDDPPHVPPIAERGEHPEEAMTSEEAAAHFAHADPVSEADAYFGPKQSSKPKEWSARKGLTPFGQRQAAWQHFYRELVIINPKLNGGVELKKALPRGLDTSIREIGIDSVCDLLEAHFKKVKEAMTAPATTDKYENDELAGDVPTQPAHWSTVDQHWQTITKNLETEAEALGIPPSLILTRAAEAIAPKTWKDFEKGGEALFAVKAVWQAQIDANKAKAAKPSATPPKSSTRPANVQQSPSTPPANDVMDADIVDDVPEEKALATIEQTISVGMTARQALTLVKAKMDLLTNTVTEVLVDGTDYGLLPGSKKKCLYKPGAEKLLSAFSLYPKCVPTAQTITDWKGSFFNFEYECTLYNRFNERIEGTGIGSCNSMEKKYRYRWVQETQLPSGVSKVELQKMGGSISEFEFAVNAAKTDGQYGKPAEYWQQFKDAIANGTAKKVQKKKKDGTSDSAWEIDATMYRVPNDEIADLTNTISKMAQKRALVAAVLNACAASAIFTQDLEDLRSFDSMDEMIA